jgi:uncharacterized protein
MMIAEAAALLPVTEILVAAFLIVMFAAIVQAMIGMGFGLAAAPLLALLDPTLVPAPPLILSLLTAGFYAVRQRAGVQVAELAIALSGRALGAALAAVVLVSLVDRAGFSILFGIATLTALAFSVVVKPIVFTRLNLLIMSTISGVMGTITSVGAPPLAILYQTRDGKAARPTLNAFFAIGAIISLVALAAAGWLGLREFVITVAMLPALLLGMLVARFLEAFSDRWFRYLLWVLAGAAGVILVVRPLLG